jgi:hypothetical protein
MVREVSTLETGKTRNDVAAAVTKLCLVLEQHRRTPEGRVRTTEEFLAAFFPRVDGKAEDRVFQHLPREVRGPILAAWGIRGSKAAVRDDDEKVKSVVNDSLVAGDLDHQGFEEALAPDIIVGWLPLGDVWTFWRGGKLSKQAIEKSLVTAYELALFDAKWFLDTIEAGGGKLRGTDVLADGLNKDELTGWMRAVHASGDGSPRGLIAALGWPKIVSNTRNEVLIAALDALSTKVGLVQPATATPAATATAASTSTTAATTTSPAATVATPTPVASPPVNESTTSIAAALTQAAERSSAPPALDDGAWGKTGQTVLPPIAPPGEDDVDIPIDDSSATEIISAPGLTKGKGGRPEPAEPPRAKERR